MNPLTRRAFVRSSSLLAAGLAAAAALPRSAGAAGPAGRVDLAALRAYLRRVLAAKHDPIMAGARPDGRFGTDPWIVRDQDVMLTLALLYRDEAGPYHGEPRLREAIAAAGRYLRTRQDAKGMWPFDKKDGSNWGQIYMPWTYLRWMITYQLMADELAPADRATWAEGLQLGYGGIAATELSSRSNIYPGPLTGHPPLRPGEVIPWIHNIPCHHAAGLFIAGQAFRRPEWQQQARDYIRLVVAAQSPYGWWTEHSGPVVLYNRVYLEALGVYFALTADEGVLPALERGNRYHLNYTYPNGAAIETVDERNPAEPVKVGRGPRGERVYLPAHVAIHPGLYFTDEGRALLGHQLPLVMARDPAELDAAEFLYLFLPKGATELAYQAAPAARFRMGSDALVARADPWVVSLSAYCCPRTGNRFIQDRQNLLSIYHRDAGLILGGGNTKLQPLWSTFTVGDASLLTPVGAKRDTNLAPDVPLAYTPDRCAIVESGAGSWALRITAGGATAEVACALVDDGEMKLTAQLLQAAPDGRPAAVHLTFLPYPDSPVSFSDGTSADLGGARWDKTGVTEVRHQYWRLAVPEAARVAGPILPHNPYTADGHAEPKEGRLVVTLPLAKAGEPVTLVLRVSAPA